MEKIKDLLNQIYGSLDATRRELTGALTEGGYSVSWGFYNGHCHRTDDGAYVADHYPIPVISVAGICDIEIELDHINISTKLSRDRALAYNYDGLGVPFEAYGVEEYTQDFFLPGMTAAEMKKRIKQSEEKEIGFSFTVESEDVLNVVRLLRSEGFYD